MYGLGHKREKEPKKEKSYEYKKKKLRNKHFYIKEDSWVKKKVQKKFRQKWKWEQKRIQWHRPVNCEYHSYGWFIW